MVVPVKSQVQGKLEDTGNPVLLTVAQAFQMTRNAGDNHPSRRSGILINDFSSPSPSLSALRQVHAAHARTAVPCGRHWMSE